MFLNILYHGLFPVSIAPYNPIQQAGSDDNRDVTFAFNEFRAYLKGQSSTWQQSKQYTTNPKPKKSDEKKNEKKNEKKTKSAEDLKKEAAQKTAADAKKKAEQIANAHNWLQSSIANAAGAMAGNVIKNNVPNLSNLISGSKNDNSSKSLSKSSVINNSSNQVKTSENKQKTLM